MESFDINNINLLTSAGVTAFTIFVSQVIKKSFFNPTWEHYSLYMNALTLIIATGASFGAVLVDGKHDWLLAITNSFIGFVGAIGAYETFNSTVSSVRKVSSKKKK